MTLLVTLDATQEAAFQFLMDRANANLAARKEKPFSSLDAYVTSLLNSYVASETKGVKDEKRAVALRKIQDDPTSLTLADKVTLGIS